MKYLIVIILFFGTQHVFSQKKIDINPRGFVVYNHSIFNYRIVGYRGSFSNEPEYEMQYGKIKLVNTDIPIEFKFIVKPNKKKDRGNFWGTPGGGYINNQKVVVFKEDIKKFTITKCASIIVNPGDVIQLFDDKVVHRINEDDRFWDQTYNCD